LVDRLDKEIIRLLRQNGRETSLNIARNLGISRITVRRRMQKLLRDRVIYFTAFNDPRRVLTSVGIFIALDVADGRREDAVKKLISQPRVGSVFYTGGRFNVMAVASFPALEALAEFLVSFLPGLEGVRERQIISVLHAEPDRTLAKGSDTVSPLGKRLLELLWRDGRRSTVALARDIGVSPPTVQRLLRQFVKNGTIHVSVIVNPARVDWFAVAILGIRTEPSQLAEVMRHMAASPLVRAAYFTTGEFDLLARLEGGAAGELYAFATELQNTRGVRRAELFPIQDVWFGETGPSGYPGRTVRSARS
jgi:DNA-binding Lrp family transcriptional regulator